MGRKNRSRVARCVRILGARTRLDRALRNHGLLRESAPARNWHTHGFGGRPAQRAKSDSSSRNDARHQWSWGRVASLDLLGRALSKFLYGIGASDLPSLVGASLVLLFVAMVACYLPARRASRLDPLVALREN